MNREIALSEIQNATDPWDFIVIGGGATGLGAAVDAAARGYRVLLLEQSDFCKGTSSRSTKLVHGGVRYLKQGNISLVLEALKERGLLCQNAPHLVHNLAFVIPIYRWWDGPFYGIGMKVYDQLAGKLGLSPSKTLSLEETLEHIPTVEPEGLVQGVRYHDGQFDDARLAINLAQTIFNLGGTAINYAKVAGFIKEEGLIKGVVVSDEETGEQYEIFGKGIINATGVYTDSLRQIDDPSAPSIIAASQGTHLVLPKEFLPKGNAIMIPHTEDGRVLFAVPWHDCTIVGTTDVPVDETPLEPRPMEEEIDFLLSHAARYLTKDPTREDVLSVFSGLRPLVKVGDAENTAAISRDHTILISDSGLLSIAGGKWTTYRKMAEDAIDQAETMAGFDSRPCRTHHLQIHGWTEQEIEDPHLGVYGADARKIRRLEKEEPLLAQPVIPGLPVTAAEIVWAVREEMARTVEDVLSRRTRALLLGAKACVEAAPKIASLMAKELGEDQKWETKTVENFRSVASGYILS
jgi:glycerol-3-phosphate dehydrogenase